MDGGEKGEEGEEKRERWIDVCGLDSLKNANEIQKNKQKVVLAWPMQNI